MRSFVIVVILSAIFFPSLLCANDGAYGGSGSAPKAIMRGDIQFVEEHVVITGKSLSNGPYGISTSDGEFLVTCDFTFKNTSDKPVKVTMGFPFDVEEEEIPVVRPKGRTGKLGSALVYDFKTIVRGKEIPVRTNITTQKKIGYEQKAYTYLWDVDFAPQEVVKISHSYVTGVSVSVGGRTEVFYRLKTGATWKDSTIGRSRIDVSFGVPTRLCSELNQEGLASDQPKPAGWKAEATPAGRIYKWDLKDYKAIEDMELCVVSAKDYVDLFLLPSEDVAKEPKELADFLGKKSPEELRRLRNTVYAKYGRVFKDAELQKYFESQWWYAANPNYSDAILTKRDLNIANVLK